MAKLSGKDAIEYARKNDLRLSKYTDPTEDARDDLTVEDAEEIAREDANLIYLEVEGMTYREAVEQLRELVGDEIIFSDGASDWDLPNLLESLDDELDEVREYVVDEEGITTRRADGTLDMNRALWRTLRVYDSPQDAWDHLVGSQTPQEFMTLSGGKGIQEAVDDYLDHCPIDLDDVDVERANWRLVQYIEHELANDTAEIVIHAGDVLSCPNGHTWTAPGDYTRKAWREGGQYDENGRPYLDCNECSSIMTRED